MPTSTENLEDRSLVIKIPLGRVLEVRQPADGEGACVYLDHEGKVRRLRGRITHEPDFVVVHRRGPEAAEGASR